MKKHMLSSILITACSCHILMAQGFADLQTSSGKNMFTEGWLKIFFQYTDMRGTYTEPKAMPTISMGLRSESDEKNGLRWSWEYSALGYAVNAFYNVVLKKESYTQYRDNHTFLTSGLLGWHKVSMNVVATDRLLISPGISTGDHMMSTQLTGTSRIIEAIGNENYLGGPIQSIDPAGYYLYAGPSLIASYVVNSKIWLDAYANYDFTVVKAFSPSNDYLKNPDYPMPTVLMFGADVHTTYYGVFAGIRYAKLSDKGAHNNSTKRIDMSIGIHF